MNTIKATPQNILIAPVNRELLGAHITALLKQAGKLEPNVQYTVQSEGIIPGIPNVVVDPECCYCIHGKTIMHAPDGALVFGAVHPVSVTRKERTSGNEQKGSYSMGHAFDYIITVADLLKFCDKPVTLEEFMGSRFNYNPRIRNNMENFIEDVGNYLESESIKKDEQ